MTVQAKTGRGLVSKGPERRRAIARAGGRVLRRSGIEGLTHRAVAEEAGVPLGSTTYYFTSRNDLLLAAVEYSVDGNIKWLQDWAAANADSDIAETLPIMLHEYLNERRTLATLDVEIYLLAARRPELRVHSSRWTASFIDLLTGFVDHEVASHTAATFNGLLLHTVSSGEPAQLEELKNVLGRALQN